MKNQTPLLHTLQYISPFTQVFHSVPQPHHVGISSEVLKTNNEKLTLAYEKYEEALFRYCFFRISNKEKAIDLVQETFIRTWQYLMKGNIIDNEKSFLYTTAHHLIIDEYRKKKCVSLDSLINTNLEPAVDSLQRVCDSIDASRVMNYVHQLPSTYSTIIIMRYVNDYSIRDIAHLMHTSENVVSVRIYRGLHKLRFLLNK